MSLAVLFGLTCTAINVWLLYKERLARYQETTLDPVVLESIEPVQQIQHGDLQRPRSKNKTAGLSFDNPNWVYGNGGSHVQQADIPSQSDHQMVIAKTEGVSPMRYATIRRGAGPINVQSALSLDHRYRLNKSASFRHESEQQRRRPAAGVHRSKTMRETSFCTSNEPQTHTFAHRFQQPGSTEGPSALSFVHDAITEEPPRRSSPSPTVAAAVSESIQEEETEIHEIRPATPPPPPRLPVIRHNVRSSDKIVLRVESFRSSPVGRPPRPSRNPNVKRVSSSTQTDMSVLMKSTALVAAQQRNIAVKRTNASQKFPGSAVAVESPDSPSKSSVGNQSAQLSPVGSSSGYSSPRGGTDDSKSPTPEPDNEISTGGNITIIQIEPPPLIHRQPEAIHQYQDKMVEAMYAIPRKRSHRSPSFANVIPTPPPPPSTPMGFQINIQQHPIVTKPAQVSRSVSFHHMSQADRRAFYSHEWLQHPAATTAMVDVVTKTNSHSSPVPPVISIPRPALRMSPQQRYVSPSPTSSSSSTAGRRHRSGSSLSRSTSMYLAMSEIQRKVEFEVKCICLTFNQDNCVSF